MQSHFLKILPLFKPIIGKGLDTCRHNLKNQGFATGCKARTKHDRKR